MTGTARRARRMRPALLSKVGRPKIGLALCLGSAAMLVGSSAEAATLYVSAEQGSDQASGLAPEAALQSLAAAVARLAPGDRLVIAPGRYDQALVINKSGTKAQPIEIAGADGPPPQIRADGDAVTIDGDYIRLSRVDASATGTLGSAIIVAPGRHHVEIADSVAHESGCAGIAANQADHVVIQHNRVFGNSRKSPWQCSGISLYQAANSDDEPGFHNIISGNIVYGNANEVPDPKLPAEMAGHTTDGSGIIVDDFRHDQLWRGQKTAPYRSATLIDDNVVYGNGGRAIQAFHSDDVTISNNTAAGDLRDPKMYPTQYGEIYLAWSKNDKVFNNLVEPQAAEPALMVARSQAVDLDYNVTIGGAGLRQDQAQIDWGGHNFAAPSAGFADARGGDYHLTSASPALGRGSAALAPAQDLAQHPRPRSGAVDAGAYQFSQGRGE
jgi:Right handed beta helix region